MGKLIIICLIIFLMMSCANRPLRAFVGGKITEIIIRQHPEIVKKLFQSQLVPVTVCF